MGERLVAAESIVPIPEGLRSRKALMDALAIDELREAYPDHEFFVVVWKSIPDNPFAVVFRAPKDRVRESDWWAGSVKIDPEKRWVVVPDVVAEMEPRR